MKKFSKVIFISLCVLTISLDWSLYPANAVINDNKTGEEAPAGDNSRDIKEVQEVLVILKTMLDAENSQVGEIFTAKTMDDLFLADNTILIPSESILTGKILRLKKPGYVFKDGYITILIDVITPPEGNPIVLNQSFTLDIYSPNRKKPGKGLIAELPSSLASSASSLILEEKTALAEGAIWLISIGAKIVGGFCSGLMMPEKDKTRVNSGLKRAFDKTPPMSYRFLTTKDKDFRLEPGDFINIRFDRETINLIVKHLPEDKAPVSAKFRNRQ